MGYKNNIFRNGLLTGIGVKPTTEILEVNGNIDLAAGSTYKIGGVDITAGGLDNVPYLNAINTFTAANIFSNGSYSTSIGGGIIEFDRTSNNYINATSSGGKIGFKVNGSTTAMLYIAGLGVSINKGIVNPREILDVGGNAILDGNVTATSFYGANFSFVDGGSSSSINNDSGILYINNNSNGDNVLLRTKDDAGNFDTQITLDGSDTSVTLHHNSISKLKTTVDGINVTGTISLNGDSLNRSGTLTNVAYLDRGNTFSTSQVINGVSNSGLTPYALEVNRPGTGGVPDSLYLSALGNGGQGRGVSMLFGVPNGSSTSAYGAKIGSYWEGAGASLVFYTTPTVGVYPVEVGRFDEVGDFYLDGDTLHFTQATSENTIKTSHGLRLDIGYSDLIVNTGLRLNGGISLGSRGRQITMGGGEDYIIVSDNYNGEGYHMKLSTWGAASIKFGPGSGSGEANFVERFIMAPNGDFTATGDIAANAFIGDGSQLTNLDYSNISNPPAIPSGNFAYTDVANIFSDSQRVIDGKNLYIGTGAGIQLYHQAGLSLIDNYEGSFKIRQRVDGGAGILQADNPTGGTLDCLIWGGSTSYVGLSYGGSQKFATTDYGVITYGNVNSTLGYQINGVDINTAGTLSNVAYLDQANIFTAEQSFSSFTVPDGGSGWFGTDKDIRLHSNGTNAYIISENGPLYIAQNAAGAYIYFNTNNSLDVLKNTMRLGGATPNVILYHDSNERLVTQSYGVNIRGTEIRLEGLNINSAGTLTNVAYLNQVNYFSANQLIEDNKNLHIGTDTTASLKFVKTGGNSYIDNQGGGLFIRSQVHGGFAYLYAEDFDGNQGSCVRWGGGTPEVSLYYDYATRLRTTAAGVTVTGDVTATSFIGDGSQLTGISGSAPSNMVTTDTEQDIVATKSFTEGIQISDTGNSLYWEIDWDIGVSNRLEWRYFNGLGVVDKMALTTGGALALAGGITCTTGTFSGSVSANSFSGDGSALTNLPTTAPTNMVTTDTSQTITGAKAFQTTSTYHYPVGTVNTTANAGAFYGFQTTADEWQIGMDDDIFKVMRFNSIGSGTSSTLFDIDASGNGEFSGTVTASQIIKNNATSDDILLGNGGTTSLSLLTSGQPSVSSSTLYSNKPAGVTMTYFKVTRYGPVVTMNIKMSGSSYGSSGTRLFTITTSSFWPTEQTFFTITSNKSSGEAQITYCRIETDGDVYIDVGSDGLLFCQMTVTWIIDEVFPP